MGNPESKPAQQFVKCNRKMSMWKMWWVNQTVCMSTVCASTSNYIIAYLIHVVENSLWVWESSTSACTALGFHFIHYINISLISFYAPGSGFCIEQYACADHYLQPPTKTIFCNECIVTSKRSHFLCWFFVGKFFSTHTGTGTCQAP